MLPVIDVEPILRRWTASPWARSRALALHIFPPIVLASFAAPFIALMFYSVPALDDFCKAALSFDGVPQHGVLRMTWMHYTRWSPRWLTAFIQSALMSRIDMVGAYGWLLLAVASVTVASLWYFIHVFMDISLTRSLLVATLFYTAWMASIANPAETLFWLTGATEYYLPLSALLVLVGLLHRFRKAAWYYVAVGLLSFAIPALHEIAGTLLCGIALVGVILTRQKKLPSSQWNLALAASTVSLAIVLFSPGNALRAAYEHRHAWDFAHKSYWIGHSLYHGITWFSAPALLAATFCIVVVSGNEQEHGTWKERRPGWLGPVSLSFIVFTFGECCLVEIASGSWLSGRLVNWFQFVLWLLFVCLILTGVREIRGIDFSLNTKIGAFVVLAMILFGSPNFRSALEDLRGPAQAWRRTYVVQFSQRGDSLTFPAVTQFPHMAMRQGLTANPGCSTNRCVAQFLGARSVVVAGSVEQCAVPSKLNEIGLQ
jgi:hypothetical protein